MGFLGDLFSKKAREVFDDKFGDTVVGKIIGDSDVDSRTHSSSGQADRPANKAANRLSNTARTRKGVIERLINVCERQFKEYELIENVSASGFNAETGAENYSFVMYKDGAPKLTIMILEGHNDYRRKSVRLAHEASEAMGVGCINIMTFLPSTEEYIETRIRQNIK